jgi:hypothetical protein
VLRQQIRNGEVLGWHSPEASDYLAFKRLACAVGALLTNRAAGRPPDAGEAAAALKAITSNTWEKIWAQEAWSHAGDRPPLLGFTRGLPALARP